MLNLFGTQRRQKIRHLPEVNKPVSTLKRVFSMLCILLVTCLIMPIDGNAKTLTISKITNNPAKHSRKMQPFVDYLVAQLSDYGYTDGKLMFVRTPQQLAKLMRAGQVDMASDTPFAYATTQLSADIEPLAIRRKNGIKEYSSIIFVRSDSGIRSLQDLAGKKIAFEDAYSTSGFALPAKALQSAQLELEKLYSPRETVSTPNVTGYIFSGSEQNTAAWVLKNLVDAGAISSIEWHKAKNFLATNAEDLMAIYTSPPVPRTIEFVRSSLAPAVKQRLKKTLLEMHTKPDTKKVLKKYQKTHSFEALNSATHSSILAMEAIAKDLVSEKL